MILRDIALGAITFVGIVAVIAFIAWHLVYAFKDETEKMDKKYFLLISTLVSAVSVVLGFMAVVKFNTSEPFGDLMGIALCCTICAWVFSTKTQRN